MDLWGAAYSQQETTKVFLSEMVYQWLADRLISLFFKGNRGRESSGMGDVGDDESRAMYV